MNRAISGTLVIRESGRPVPGLIVVAVQEQPWGLDSLGAALSGDFGRFRITYPRLCGPADLTLLLFTPSGSLLFTGACHRQVSGAELNVTVEIPGEAVEPHLCR